jgi:carbon storage regulator
MGFDELHRRDAATKEVHHQPRECSMLVLTRKHQEKIRIGDHIVITVLKTKGKTVRLGIEAPAEVPVIRGELSFVGQTVEWEADADESEPELPQSAKGEKAGVDRVRNHWPSKATASAAPAGDVSQVSFERVSRSQVGQVLPKLVAGRGPLGAMLDRRSVSA